MFLLWVIRFFFFKLHESPKYLMGKGRDADAVEVVHQVAAFNGTTSSLTLEDLTCFNCNTGGQQTTTSAALKRQISDFSGGHLAALFNTPKMAWSTSMVLLIWGELCRCGSGSLLIVDYP